MKKLIISLALFVSCGYVLAQETAIRNNDDHLFYEGRTLFEQRKFGASTKKFEQFCATAANKNSGLYADAQYYIACNAYELKRKDAVVTLKNYLNNYPYAPMREHVAYMIDRC